MVVKCLTAIVLFLLLVPSAAMADDPFNLSFTDVKDTNIAYVGDASEYVIKVISNLNRTVTADVVLSLNYKDWATAGKKTDFVINTSEPVLYGLELTPSLGTSTDNYNPIVHVCVKDTDQCSDIILRLHVVDRSQLHLDLFKSVIDSYDADENISVMFTLNNRGKSEISNYKFRVDLKRGDDVIASQLFDLDAIDRGDQLIRTEYIDFTEDITVSGIYTLEGILVGDTGDVLNTTSVDIMINPVKDSSFDKIVSVNPGILKKQITITLKNEEALPNKVILEGPVYGLRQIYSFDSPVSILSEDGEMRFQYVCELNSKGTEGDSCTLSYTVNYWKLYLLAILLFSLLFLIYLELERPKITKSHIKKAGMHTIHITFRNNSLKPLNNVVIKERIPSSVRNVSGFSIRPASQMKKEDYIEIIWKIGKLESKEERVITYSIRPRLEVEDGIVLPPVEISGTNYRKKRECVKSGNLHLK